MGRSLWSRRLVHGALAGVLISCLRAPLGLDWTQLVAVQGTTAALFRVAALLALALALDPDRAALRGGPSAAWLAAVCAGYALHGLVLDVTPSSRAGFALLLVAGTLLMRALAGARGGPGAPTRGTLQRGERLGLLLVGLGSALALETLAHEVRLYTMATTADDTLVGTVFLALVATGAAAFGPLLAKVGSERPRFPAGVALAGAACLAGLLFLTWLTPSGLHGYLRRFDVLLGGLRALDGKLGGALGVASLPPLDGASIGTLWTTSILAAAALIGPGFVLGATLGSTLHFGRLAHTLVGASIGLIVLPSLIRAWGEPLTPPELGQAAFAWKLQVAGVSTAALGLAVVALGGARGRLAGIALALLVAAVPWLRPRLVQWGLSPWSAKSVMPELVWPMAEGLLTVEIGREGRPYLTLDRKRLTPTAEEEGADERRLRLAWSLLAEERRAGPVRALLVGQLTSARARVLRSLGELELDRTAPWHLAMPRVDGLLLGAEEPPPGRVVAPAEARVKLDDGHYDWVIVPPTHGPIVAWKSEAREIWGSAEAPRFTGLELENDTLGVAWLVADALVSRGASLEPLMLSVERLESFALALVRGQPDGSRAAVGPLFRIEAHSAPGPLRFLGTMPQQRAFLLEGAWASSLESDARDLARGLALHFQAQQLSSPYETRAQQIEVDEEALRAFFAAVPEPGALDSLSRELWESMAWLLCEKRMPEQALVYLEPVAEAFAPWPALDRALAQAYLEVLEPQSALHFLERALRVLPDDVELLAESARCAGELGDPQAAAGFLERALAIRPERWDLLRAFGLALVRAGDERGKRLVERLLVEEPEDAELREALGGPAAGTDGM